MNRQIAYTLAFLLLAISPAPAWSQSDSNAPDEILLQVRQEVNGAMIPTPSPTGAWAPAFDATNTSDVATHCGEMGG